MRGAFKTKQRDLIMDYLSKNRGQVLTAEMIIKALAGKAGQTTIYRNLDKLSAEKMILKMEMPDGKSACYQYCDRAEDETHCHLLCTSCGRVVELDCNYISELNTHISTEHRFKIDRAKTVLYGSCESCG